MSDLLSSIYHEKQEPGSMMCLQHSINNLLQSELFSPASLADIARELDALESAQLDPGTRLRGETSSQNVDESGFFSVQVAEKALEVLGLRLVRWGNRELAHMHNNPEQIEAFLLNHQMHWFSIRRFAPNRFYNLDSCTPQPTWVSEMSLGLHLREFELQGYSIFAITPSPESHLHVLPPCDASNIASTLGPPSGGGNGASSFASGSGSSSSNNNNSHIRFNGAGHSLGGASSSSSASNPFSSGLNPTLNRTLSKGKRPASDEDDDDDDIIIDDSRVASAGSSSVEEESEQRRRRRKMNNDSRGSQPQNGNGIDRGGGNGGGDGGMEMSEEDMMAKAIEESLRATRLNPGEQSVNEAGESSATTSARPRSRAAEAEEEEFQRALQASLAAASGEGQGGDGMDEEEDDAPTMEELRARRLARFA
ncbi:hypothetical protein JCM5353_008752 [Sporobolomyces roseus]